MPPHSSADTPVMRQYQEVKDRYPDCLVFFRMGDFYEMFFADAVWAAGALDLALTSRDKNKDEGVPMCGVPHHAARTYIARAVALGKKVALCEQVEDARLAKKIVRRAVTQVITPGVLLDEDQLQPKVSNFLAALCPGSGAEPRGGLALLDVTTGEFSATEGPLDAIHEELLRAAPAELLRVVPDPAAPDPLAGKLRVPTGHAAPKTVAEDRATLTEALAAAAPYPEGPGAPMPHLLGWPLAAAAAAACVRYARATQPVGALPLYRLRLYELGDALLIDAATRDNLELFQTLMERKTQGSLFAHVDRTMTAMGGRLLRGWLGAPLQKVAAIRRRHDAVEWLLARHRLRTVVRQGLNEMSDLGRLTGRLSLGVATPRDLRNLQDSLQVLPRLAEALAAGAREPAGDLPLGADGAAIPELIDLGTDLCADVAQAVAAAIVDDPPAAWREGGFLRRGYHADLDELCDLTQGGKDAMLRIEEREREKSGISSLKVRYNRVFGYYFEITRSNLQRAPAHFIRKQTLANAERFSTEELEEYAAKVLGAEERQLALSLELYEKLVQELARAAPRLLDLAERVARLDVLAALAELAHEGGYVRPEVDEGTRLQIEDGRHPVIERLLPAGQFVPNDTALDPDDAQLVVITGPNMAGKSTVMRQVALLVILAQMGSYVPARSARIGVVDRVFTRVGASDNLARGESTFMVEMRETANILQNASRRSLVVLDEIGRGTSTYDGVSIAWAVAEHLHDAIGCKALFATHYHELCALADSHARVRNLSVAVSEHAGEVVFLHKLVDGGASRSYGIEVARLAGLPRTVVSRAREILKALEFGAAQDNQDSPDNNQPLSASDADPTANAPESTTADSPAPSATARARPAPGPRHGPLPSGPDPQLGLFQAFGASLGQASHALESQGTQTSQAPQAPRRPPTKAPRARADQNPAPVATHAPPPPPAKDPREQAVLDRLRALDADGLTPRDALAMVAALAEEVRALRAG